MFVTLTLNPAIDCTLKVTGALRAGGVHSVKSETRTPGGKGINVAKMLAANGCAVCATAILGEADRAFYDAHLLPAGIETAWLTVPHPTRINLMLTGEEGQEIKINRPGFPLLDFDWDPLWEFASGLLGRGEVFILSGSLPARFPPDAYPRLIERFIKAGKRVVLDTSGAALAAGVRASPHLIKPNREELQELLGRALRDDGAIRNAMRDLLTRHETVIASNGARGAYFASADGVFHASSPPVHPVDTTGAGDALLGQFCADYYPGRQLTPWVMARAVAAGSAAVELPGTPAIPVQRVRQLAEQVTVRVLDDPK